MDYHAACALVVLELRTRTQTAAACPDCVRVVQLLQEAATSLLVGQSMLGMHTVAIDPGSHILSSDDTKQLGTVSAEGDLWGWHGSSCSQPGSMPAPSIEQQHHSCWDTFVASVDQQLQKQYTICGERLGQVSTQKQTLWLVIDSLSTLVVYHTISKVTFSALLIVSA